MHTDTYSHMYTFIHHFLRAMNKQNHARNPGRQAGRQAVWPAGRQIDKHGAGLHAHNPAFSIEQQLSIEPEITPILSIDPDFTTMYAFVQRVGGKEFGYDVCRACGCSIMGWTDRRM